MNQFLMSKRRNFFSLLVYFPRQLVNLQKTFFGRKGVSMVKQLKIYIYNLFSKLIKSSNKIQHKINIHPMFLLE
jgi:hypothetical protein